MKSKLIGGASLTAGLYMLYKKYRNNTTRNNEEQLVREDKINNISKYLYSEEDDSRYSEEDDSRHTSNIYNKINITFIKNLIGNSLRCDDIPNLEEGLRLLNEYINGYNLLSDKFNKTRILNIYNHLCKLKILRSKVHYELGCRYDNKYNTDKANENYLLAINFADENEQVCNMIIRKSFTRLVNNGFIIN